MKMMSRLPDLKAKLPKCVLLVTLLLSIFSFSSSFASSLSSLQQATQTEIVFSPALKSIKPTASYRQTVEEAYLLLNETGTYYYHFLVAYNLLIQVESDSLLSHLLAFKPAPRFCQRKTISKSATDDHLWSLLG
jgi:hypothetical protein